MAVWALSRLLPQAAFASLRNNSMNHEADAEVRREWEAA
jgi:hypothetical protein